MKFLHFSIHKSYIRVCDRIIGIQRERLQEISDRLLIFAHILQAAASVMIENWVCSIKFYSFAELSIRAIIVFQFIVDHSFSIVYWWERWICFDKLLEIMHSLAEFSLAIIEKSKMIEAIDIYWIYL